MKDRNELRKFPEAESSTPSSALEDHAESLTDPASSTFISASDLSQSTLEKNASLNPPTRHESEQRRAKSTGEQEAMNQNSTLWWTASMLLLAVAALFLLTLALPNPHPSILALRSFCEAALVGGLADWFAVTALFRRPLGLPIPHTAIVPANKERIGQSLGRFIQENFFSKDALDTEVVNISGGITRWLAVEENRKMAVERFRHLLPPLLETLQEDDIRRFIDREAEEVIKEINFPLCLARVLRLLRSEQLHERVLDEVFRQGRNFFQENKLWFRKEIRAASPWFIPQFVDQRIFGAISSKTEETFNAALNDPNHELRRRAHQFMEEFIYRLENSEEMITHSEELKRILLASPDVRDYIDSLRKNVFQGIQRDLLNQGSTLGKILERMLAEFSQLVGTSMELQHRLNRSIRQVLSALIGEEGEFLAIKIAATVNSWDTQTVVQKLEQEVSADLQFIRMNGTLVGGSIGLLLHLITQAF